MHQVGDGDYTYGTTKQWKGSKYEKVKLKSKWKEKGEYMHDVFLSFCINPSEVDLTHPQKDYLIYLVKPNKGTKFMNWAENPFGREG